MWHCSWMPVAVQWITSSAALAPGGGDGRWQRLWRAVKIRIRYIFYICCRVTWAVSAGRMTRCTFLEWMKWIHLQSFVHVSFLRLPFLSYSFECRIALTKDSADYLLQSINHFKHQKLSYFFPFIALTPKREFYSTLWLCGTLLTAHYKCTSVSSTWSHHHGFPLSQ